MLDMPQTSIDNSNTMANKKKDPMPYLFFRLPIETRTILEQVARAEDRTLSSLMRHIVNGFLRRHKPSA